MYFESLDSNLDISNENIELMSIIIERKFQRALCISVVYLLPKSNVEIAIESLSNIGDKLASKDLEWIIGGDFNIDIGSNKRCKKKNLLANFTSKFLLYQTIS